MYSVLVNCFAMLCVFIEWIIFSKVCNLFVKEYAIFIFYLFS